MRQILYKFHNSGMYVTEDDTAFGRDAQLKLVVEPHDFSLTLGGEVLRSSSCGGYEIEVTREGAAAFYAADRTLVARTEKDEGSYWQVRLVWKQAYLQVQFGQIQTVDYYPNCDGEHDRWGTEWVTERSVTLNLMDNSLEVE